MDATIPKAEAISVTLPVNCALISTAQQKKVSFKTRRIFTNKRVAAGMRVIELLARPHSARIIRAFPHGTPVSVEATFLYEYPKGTPQKRLLDRTPLPQGADLDNRWKAVGDALTAAGWWQDDRNITTLILRKRRTTTTPRIEITIAADK